MPHILRLRSFLFLSSLAIIAAHPAPAGALTGCKARASTSAKTPGAVLVLAKDVNGPVFWGTVSGKETEPCQPPQKGNVCPLGANGSLAASTPPATCRLFLKDSVASCAVTVIGCSPGVRIRDASFAADDPRVEAVSLEDDGGTLRFTGVNLQVVNGTGSTYGAVNGRGNLIVGYNERKQCQFSGSGVTYFIAFGCNTDDDCGGAAAGYTCVTMDSSGSHNLVVGSANGYSSYGGSAVGFGHSIEGPWCATAGINNRASGLGATVAGGILNTASGSSSAVAGGGVNLASNNYSSVFGGEDNQATEVAATVVGGAENVASGKVSLVVGGQVNVASGPVSWVGGGEVNHATADLSWVGGGTSNQATTFAASVAGGICNIAGLGTLLDPADCDPSEAGGFYTVVTGGWRNQAAGSYSTVTGGQDNTASGGSSSVSGGNGVVQSAGFGWSAGSTGTAVSGRFSSP